MSKNSRKPAPRKQSASTSGIDLNDVARQVAEGRALSAQVAQLMCEFEKCAAQIESHLQELRRTRKLGFPRPN